MDGEGFEGAVRVFDAEAGVWFVAGYFGVERFGHFISAILAC